MRRRSMKAAALVATLLLASGCSFWEIERGEDGQVLRETVADVFDLQRGDCINDSQVGAASEVELTDITIIPCSEPHSAEVYVDVRIGDGLPAEERFEELFEKHCVDAFAEYVGVEYTEAATESLGITAFYPTTESWNRGDRLFQCLIIGTDDLPLVGSAEGLLAD